MHNVARTYLLNRLNFLRLDELELTDEQKKLFDELYENYIINGVGDEFPYLLQEKKYKFLTYLIENKNVLVHGSNNPDIEAFEPRNSTLFTGEKVKAVFASSDATWSLFFAVINRNDYYGSLRNLCLTAQTSKGVKRYYYFSLNEDFRGEIWQGGMIYLFPKDRFKPGGAKNEWISEKEVYPLAKVRVSPEDFIFRDFILRHREDTSHIKNLVRHLLFPKRRRRM
ncbi:hypothetical protein [Paucisalibacillus globulus]|jgi:hypothetical protein|uniref:hypothetical protein n=1 Tax=Paucisalibacillus globulus TaxID=351095 RepID=UPI000BB85F4A|nr:hypothetical protein [Paucisalibacillus globulus]